LSSEFLKPDGVIGELGGALRKLSTRTILFQTHAAASIGVIHTDLKTADILNETGPITAGELGKITGLTTGTVTALIDRLESAGVVRREKDPSDRRRVIIVPISNKNDQIREIYQPLSQSVARLGANYTNGELELILGYINGLIDIYEDESKRLIEGNFKG
jgi:DNA-binding MarR family transcriptional regulator